MTDEEKTLEEQTEDILDTMETEDDVREALELDDKPEETDEVRELREEIEELKERVKELRGGGLRGIQTPTMIHKHLDNFLAKMAGETPVDDNPRNSTEYWLNEIAENGPGKKVYQHRIIASNKDFGASTVGDYIVSFDLITDTATPITTFTELYGKVENKIINASGVAKNNNNDIIVIVGIYFIYSQMYKRGYNITTWDVDTTILDHEPLFVIYDEVLPVN